MSDLLSDGGSVYADGFARPLQEHLKPMLKRGQKLAEGRGAKL